MDFAIDKVDKILYSDGNFKFVDDSTLRNDHYLDDMNQLKREIEEKDRRAFFK